METLDNIKLRFVYKRKKEICHSIESEYKRRRQNADHVDSNIRFQKYFFID